MSTNAKVKVEESALEKAMRLCKEVDEEEERERLKEEEVKRKEEADKKRRDEVEKYNKSVMREAEENRKKELETKEEEALRLKEAKDKEEAVLLPASLSTSLPNLLIFMLIYNPGGYLKQHQVMKKLRAVLEIVLAGYVELTNLWAALLTNCNTQYFQTMLVFQTTSGVDK